MAGPIVALALLPINERGVQITQGALAIAATALLLWRREAKDRSGAPRRLPDALLALFGVVGLAAWSGFGHFHFDDYIHDWDAYHYYIGAKYLPELQYTRLYDCTAVAEQELALADPPSGLRLIRSLTTNELVPAATALSQPQRCRSRFSAVRWEAFRADIGFFKQRTRPDRWEQIQQDHGFNGTPVWAIAGYLLTNLGPATFAQLLALTSLDLVLLAVIWICLVWGFGWRAACVCAVAFGTSHAARFGWNGGSLLRFDWLCALVCGLVCLKRGRSFWAGFLLCTSALLRVFPAFALAAVVLLGVQRAFAQPRGEMRQNALRLLRPLLAGAALAAALGAGLSVAIPGRGSLALWSGFVGNSRKHLATPLNNNLGLQALVYFQTPEMISKADRPPGSITQENKLWRARRALVASARWPLYFVLLAAGLALLAGAARREEAWVVAILGIGFVPLVADLTCYYFVFQLCLGLLWVRRPAVGIALCAQCALQSIAGLLLPEGFLLGAVLSAAVVLLWAFAAAAVALDSAPPCPEVG